MPVPPPTARLVFREMTPDDLDAMHRLLGDPVVMWVYPEPYTREQVAEWIAMNRRSYRDRGFGLWILALRETGEFVGECGLTPQALATGPEIELGYHVLPGFQGHGLATEAAVACRDFARDVARLDRIVSLIDPRNLASQRVAAKVGLVLEGEIAVPTKVLGVYATSFQAPAGRPCP